MASFVELLRIFRNEKWEFTIPTWPDYKSYSPLKQHPLGKIEN